MRITLKNFRCHTDSTFTIPDQGLVALSGNNGAGKSSVFAAISYALYGKIPGKIKKPYTHGKTTSSVELEYLGLEIIRQAAPKRLLVTMDGEVYEGEPAQSIINDKMGMTYEEYLCVAHVIQRSNTSILSMTASKQIEFVQTLANSTAEKYKEEVKLKIKQTNAEMLGVQGELKVLNIQKEEKEALYPEVPVAPKEIKSGINPAKVRETIKKLELDTKSKQKELDKARRDLETQRHIEKQKSDIQSKITKLEIEVTQLQGMYNELAKTSKPSKKLIKEMDESITKLKVSGEYYRNYLSYLKEKDALDGALAELQESQFSKMQELELQVVDKETLEIMEKEIGEAEVKKGAYDARKAKSDLDLSLKEDARKKLVEHFRTIRKSVNIPKDVKTAQKMIALLCNIQKDMREEIEVLKKRGRKRFCCPECSVMVFLSEDETQLEVLDGVDVDTLVNVERDDDTINAIQASINIIGEYIKTVDHLSKDLNIKVEDPGDPPKNPIDLHKELLKATRLRAEYDALKNGKLPPVIERMKKSVEKLTEEFVEETSTFEETQDYLSQLEEERDIKAAVRESMISVMEKMSEYQKEISSKQKIITKLKMEMPSTKENGTVEKMEKNVALLTQKISDLNLEIGAQRKILDNVADYEHYQNTLLEISVLCQKIADVDERYTALERKMEGLYGLEETEKEAEILALEETVNSINEHARIYLDQVFSDPILVKLECVKDKGKGVAKLQMNTAIEYQGDTYDDIEELSGGERQRCDVAFLLAVNDMYGSKILILDECLNELDSSVNTDVLTIIRDLCGDSRLILVISHEAVRGLFDDEIPISH